MSRDYLEDQIREMGDELKNARETIAEQQQFIDEVSQSSLIQATILWHDSKYVAMSRGNDIVSALMPSKKDILLKVGDRVFVHPMSGQIVSLSHTPPAGPTAEFKRKLDAGMIEATVNGETIIIYGGAVGEAATAGDELTLDFSGKVVIANRGRAKTDKVFTQSTGVSFDQIGGLLEAKRELQDVLLAPHQNPELFEFYNRRPAKGILMYGPPGCGKTMLAKACATTLAELNKGKGVTDEGGFIYIKGPEVLDRYVGVAEATIRRIFTSAREFKRTNGYPALVFIDEADALLGRRGSGISSDMEKTIVPAFLAEMDGLEDSGAIVILATNRADTLDEAVIRDGRIDKKIMVPRPDQQACMDIFFLNLQELPTNAAADAATLAVSATEYLFSKDHLLYSVQTKRGVTHEMHLKHIVNGAMIYNCVAQATEIAMHRDIASGQKSGLSLDDLLQGVAKIAEQNRGLIHHDDIKSAIGDDEVETITRV